MLPPFIILNKMRTLLQLMQSQVGVQEDPQHTNHGTKILEYLASVGLPGGYPWCQALMHWCGDKAYGQEGNPVPKTGSVIDCLNKAKTLGYNIIYSAEATPKNIVPGMQMIMDLGHGAGHTGVVESVDPNGTLHTIEGNSNNDGSRDGYMICRQSKRHLSDKAIIAFINYPDNTIA